MIAIHITLSVHGKRMTKAGRTYRQTPEFLDGRDTYCRKCKHSLLQIESELVWVILMKV